jgi:hypothetical protein
MLLHISTLSGSLPPIDVPVDATTQDLKRRIQIVCPETANRKMRLMKSENVNKGAAVKFVELKMDKLLSSYGVKDGSQLSVVFGGYHVIDRVRYAIVSCLNDSYVHFCIFSRLTLTSS